jgi:pyruvate kinase
MKPQEASALLDFFLGDIKLEVETVDKIKVKKEELERDLKVRYKKRENIDKLHLFRPLEFVSESTNNKLKAAALIREEIDRISISLSIRLEEVDQMMPALQRDIDVFKTLFAKEEDKQRLRSLKQAIADLSKQVAECRKVS